MSGKEHSEGPLCCSEHCTRNVTTARATPSAAALSPTPAILALAGGGAARHRIPMALSFDLVLSVPILDRVRGYLHREKGRGVDLERVAAAETQHGGKRLRRLPA